MTGAHLEITCRDVDVVETTSHEYQFVAVATAAVDGPDGAFRLHRRYQALPYHNDVVDPDAVDSNDELVDRPNDLHVHTKVYAIEGGSERYLFDDHETWTPRDTAVLENEAAFLDACRTHHVTGVREAYARAVDEGNRPGG